MRKKTNDMIHNSQNVYYQYNKIVWFNGKQSKKKKKEKSYSLFTGQVGKPVFKG